MNNSGELSLHVNSGRLHVDGELNFTTAAQMTPVLRQCIGDLPESFTVDLSELGTFNSAVLVFMLDCVRMSANAHKQCQFAGATPALGNMLKMASLEELIPGS